MNSVRNRESGDAVVDRKRQDLEESIALLEDYKLEIENNCEARSEATLGLAVPCKQDDTRAELVEEMVLINRRSCAEQSMNGCSRNRLDNDGGDLGEKEGIDNHCFLHGNINTSDVDELISLFNDCLQKDVCEKDCKDVVDFRQASPCSKLVRRKTVVEELLKVKRNSSHGLVPMVSRVGYIIDSSGGCKQQVIVPKVLKNPKKSTQKKWDEAD